MRLNKRIVLRNFQKKIVYSKRINKLKNLLKSQDVKDDTSYDLAQIASQAEDEKNEYSEEEVDL